MPDKPINRERAEAALHFLAHSDMEVAVLKVGARSAELALKRTRAAIFKISDGTVADRTAIAETASEAVSSEEIWLDAELAYEKLRNQRSSALLVFEMFRTLEASRRQGSSI